MRLRAIFRWPPRFVVIDEQRLRGYAHRRRFDQARILEGEGWLVRRLVKLESAIGFGGRDRDGHGNCVIDALENGRSRRKPGFLRRMRCGVVHRWLVHLGLLHCGSLILN